MKKIILVLILLLSGCKQDYQCVEPDERYPYGDSYFIPTDTTYTLHDDFYIDVSIEADDLTGSARIKYNIELIIKDVEKSFYDINMNVQEFPDSLKKYVKKHYSHDSVLGLCSRTHSLSYGYPYIEVIKNVHYQNLEDYLRQDLHVVLEYDDKEEVITIPKDKIKIIIREKEYH